MDFLKSHKSSEIYSPQDVLAILKNSNESSLSTEDSDIASRLFADISSTNCLPEWWTSQESAYLTSLSEQNRAIGYIIFRHKIRTYPQEYFVPGFPIYVLIEPVSSCNLRCPFCFQSDKTFTRKPYMGFMDMDLFTRIVDECEEGGTGAITLASRGEPTLHPNFCEMLDYLSDKFYEIKINTNATRLTEDICHAILRNEVNDVVLSIDSEQPEVFEILRKNAKFDKVLNHVRLINQIRNDHYPESRTVIRISAVESLPEQDRASFAAFWDELADEITIELAEERWDTYTNTVRPDLTTPCEYPWERFYVWFDGICNPCDVDYKSELSPGTIANGTSIRDIWKSTGLEELRRAHLAGERTTILPCDRCGVCQ